MAPHNSFPLIIILLISNCLATSSGRGGDGGKYVRVACSVTRYRNLCVHSLAPFSGVAKTSPSKWARAGVSVTLSEAKAAAAYLAKLQAGSNNNRGMRGRNRAALSDCVECFESAMDELHRSLGVLRSLSKRTFGTQMGDLNTWLSATLTDADTCLDGFQGQKGPKELSLIRSKVSRVGCFASNALALVNKLATTGFDSVDSDTDTHTETDTDHIP